MNVSARRHAALLSGVSVLLLWTGPALAKNTCDDLASRMEGHWADRSTRITATQFHDAPEALSLTRPGGPRTEVTLPPHCEVFGVLHERVGANAQSYAIKFHLRLPVNWNQRFFFQGGGGTNGDIGNALGSLGEGVTPALLQGYAVVSQDAGHDNKTNTDPMRGGVTAFGFDLQARADYGHASLQPVSKAAKAIIAAYYGESSRFSYFAGCSKGGAEGMALAQRYPQEFDGILAAAPGFSLPRAALTQAWDTQTFAGVTEEGRQPNANLSILAHTFSDADLALVAGAVRSSCDADDGLADGIVGAYEQCTQKKVQPALVRLQCKAAKTPDCLSSAQISALNRVYAGPVDSKGGALYSNWPWDTGIASFGWRMWKLGTFDGALTALNITLGGASLSSIFTTPPTALRDDPQAQFDFIRRFDFDRDAKKLYATTRQFPRSAWEDLSARSSDLSGFKARGGKMLVPHGLSDPVFSANDTLAWYREVDRRTAGAAATFVRVFPVPGMAHCGGGVATDQYDAFNALVTWVERGQAPDRLVARAGPATPWPNRERPLCPYPQVARFKGEGSTEVADSFVCR